MTKILLKRGNFANLPSSADLGELLLTLDTKQLFMGKGVGQSLEALGLQGPQGAQGYQGAQGFQGQAGGGASITRYATASSPNCQVLATGSGVDITISGSPPTAVITVPVGVQIITASLYLTSTQLSTNTNFLVTVPSGFGVGTGSSYYAIQYICFRDTPGSRAAVGAINWNTAQNTLQITGLTANMNYIMNIAF
jgi:hypothetical protein